MRIMGSGRESESKRRVVARTSEYALPFPAAANPTACWNNSAERMARNVSATAAPAVVRDDHERVLFVRPEVGDVRQYRQLERGFDRLPVAQAAIEPIGKDREAEAGEHAEDRAQPPRHCTVQRGRRRTRRPPDRWASRG